MKKYVLKRDPGSLPEKLTRYQAELNEEQFRVVTAQPKATLVVAGAGTGKTRAITYRVAYLIEQGISPQRILLATFTNRASREMLRRVESLTGSQNVHRVWGGTFHRIANLILRRHATSIGFESNYSILDSEDSRDFIDVCIAESAIDTKSKRFPKAEVIQNIISYATNTDLPIENVIVGKYPYFEQLTQQIKYVDSIYMERKRERNVMDYDDLLLNWKRLLVTKQEIADLYAEQFQHILVDEYQDTNRLQAELIDLLAVKHRNVMVVGDDAQSIFAWRGAEFTNIYEFPKRYPDAQLFKLETNYRSTPEILGLANTSIASNRRQFPKVLQAVKASRDFKPAIIPCSDVEQQSAFVASRILELRDEGVCLEDIAVLYRSHYHSIELQLELTRRNIPYTVRSGVRFFEQAHIKDVVSYLRIIVNPRDELAWKRILKMIPGIGNATANKIYQAILLSVPPAQAGGLAPETDTTDGNATVIERASLSATDAREVRSVPPAQAGGLAPETDPLDGNATVMERASVPATDARKLRSVPPAQAGGLLPETDTPDGNATVMERASFPSTDAGELGSVPPAQAGGLAPETDPPDGNADERVSFSVLAKTLESAAIPPSIKSKTPWQNFVSLIGELTRDDTKGNPAKQIETVLSSGYDQYLQETYENADARMEDLHGLAVYASRYNTTETFLSELALLSTERFKEPQPLTGEDVVSGGDEDECLTLTSVHQAKGLEWKVVFIIWAAEGKFPSPRSLKEIDSEEEERRLWYVALTRAKDELYITYPLIITDYNRQTVLQKPSRFITECPPALFEIWSLEEETPNFDAPLMIGEKKQEFIN